jgi:hypothetical protein
MYIVCETLASNDKRYLPDMERIYSHWIYTTYYIPRKIDLSNYEAVEVSEQVARSQKFANANKGKIGLRTGSLAHEEVFGESTEPDGEKTYYYITPEDEALTVELLKVEMDLYLKTHYKKVVGDKNYSKYQTKRIQIEKEIQECKSIVECKILQHKRFGLDSLHAAKTSYDLGDATYDLSEPGVGNPD